MANTPHPANPAPAPTPTGPNPNVPAAAPPAPYSSYPGGMASDPAAQLANEIATNIRGMPDRLRGQIDSTPALKSLLDMAADNLNAEIYQSIRRLVDDEVAKATGGLSLNPNKTVAEREGAAERRTP